MKRILLPLAIGLGILSAAPAVAAARTTPTLRLQSTSDGKLLVNRHGDTLYMFTRDGRNSDRCVALAGCRMAWPPLTVTGKPTLGAGLKRSLVGTIRIAGGARQVTYGGHPLYTFSGDTGPAETDYIGFNAFGGNWYGVSATAHRVTG